MSVKSPSFAAKNKKIYVIEEKSFIGSATGVQKERFRGSCTLAINGTEKIASLCDAIKIEIFLFTKFAERRDFLA